MRDNRTVRLAFNAQGQYSQSVPGYTVWDFFADYRLNKAAKVL